MSYGLTIKNDEGKAFISPNATPMNFIKKMDIWINKASLNQRKYLNTGISDNYIMLPFIRAIEDHNNAPAMVGRLLSIDGAKVIEIVHEGYYPFNLEVYLFANYVPKLTNYGLEIYDENHDIIYNNTCQPLEIHFLKKPDHRLFGQNGEMKERDNIMIDIGFPVAALCTSYGLKSFHIGAQNGHIEYDIFSTAIKNSVGLHLKPGKQGKYAFKYPNIGDIPYIDVRKYK